MSADFYKLLEARHSVRAYRPDPVPRATLERICTAARRAPSGANLQPGHFHVLTGAPLAHLCGTLEDAIAADTPQTSEYSYFPEPMPPELKARQRAAGFGLYAALGIDKRDLEGRRAQFLRNYRFFDAPVGIIVTIDRDMGKGGFMDLGLSLMALLLAARAEGLGSTAIGAFANYGPQVHGALGLPEDQLVVCGIALGVAEDAAPVNQFRTEREALESFTSFHGFAP